MSKRPSQSSGTVINLELGQPSTAEAMQRLSLALSVAKKQRTVCLKIIHGYGSSGRGEGLIGKATRSRLSKLQRAGDIKGYIAGEELGCPQPGNPKSSANAALVELCPQLRRDEAYARGNYGVTFVIL